MSLSGKRACHGMHHRTSCDWKSETWDDSFFWVNTLKNLISWLLQSSVGLLSSFVLKALLYIRVILSSICIDSFFGSQRICSWRPSKTECWGSEKTVLAPNGVWANQWRGAACPRNEFEARTQSNCDRVFWRNAVFYHVGVRSKMEA